MGIASAVAADRKLCGATLGEIGGWHHPYANYFSKIALFGFVCAILQPCLQPSLLSPSRFSFPLHARTGFVRPSPQLEQAMKRVSQNLARHENGTYYLDIKRGGRQIRRSLETSNQREAKRRLKAELRRLTGESGNQAQSHADSLGRIRGTQGAHL
jgi:hypothetical protein